MQDRNIVIKRKISLDSRFASASPSRGSCCRSFVLLSRRLASLSEANDKNKKMLGVIIVHGVLKRGAEARPVPHCGG